MASMEEDVLDRPALRLAWREEPRAGRTPRQPREADRVEGSAARETAMAERPRRRPLGMVTQISDAENSNISDKDQR